MKYSEERREAILRKLLPPEDWPVAEVATEEGISAPTLYAWRKQARAKGRLLPDHGRDPEGWTSRDKFSAVVEAAAMSEIERAELSPARPVSGADPTLAPVLRTSQRAGRGRVPARRRGAAPGAQAQPGAGTGGAPQGGGSGGDRGVADPAKKSRGDLGGRGRRPAPGIASKPLSWSTKPVPPAPARRASARSWASVSTLTGVGRATWRTSAQPPTGRRRPMR
jgi:transposase-like protein